MKHLWIEQEKVDGKKNKFSFVFVGKNICFFYRMSLNEFKLAYTQINPNVNFYNLDADAERMNFSFSFLVLFFSVFLVIIIHRSFYDVRY